MMSYVVPVAIPAFGGPRISLTIPGPTTGTWDQSIGRGIELSFCFTSDPTNGQFTTPTANAWLTGNFISHSTQTNFASTLNRYFLLGDVQLEAGSVATPFEVREQGVELVMCRRYFEKMSVGFIGAAPYVGGYVGNIQSWTVGKRVVPTLSLEAPTDNTNAATLATVALTQSGVRIWATPSNAANAFYTAVISGDAEL